MRNPTADGEEPVATGGDPGEEGEMHELEAGEDLLVEPGGWTDSQNGAGTAGRATLFRREEATEYRTRWESIQAGFIDEPRRAVEQADNLIDRVLKHLMDGLTVERDELVRRWDRGPDEVTTEDLRLTLQGYRTLLERLLSASL